MLQPQQVTVFPAEHMVTIVHFGLRPNASKHHIRVCACLAAQFAFFSRADSGVLLTDINAQVSDSTFSINQTAKNVARNQDAPSSRVSSAQDDPDNCFNKLQLRWKLLRNHRVSDLYWFFEDDPASLSKTPVSLPSSRSSSWSLGGARHSNSSRSQMDRSFFVSRWRLCFARHRRVDCSNHGLGLMEVSRFSAPLHRRLGVTVLRSSLLLRPPTYEFQSSSSDTRSTRSVNCCELVDRPE